MADCRDYKNDEAAGDRRNPDDHPQRLEQGPTTMLRLGFLVGR